MNHEYPIQTELYDKATPHLFISLHVRDFVYIFFQTLTLSMTTPRLLIKQRSAMKRKDVNNHIACGQFGQWKKGRSLTGLVAVGPEAQPTGGAGFVVGHDLVLLARSAHPAAAHAPHLLQGEGDTRVKAVAKIKGRGTLEVRGAHQQGKITWRVKTTVWSLVGYWKGRGRDAAPERIESNLGRVANGKLKCCQMSCKGIVIKRHER